MELEVGAPTTGREGIRMGSRRRLARKLRVSMAAALIGGTGVLVRVGLPCVRVGVGVGVPGATAGVAVMVVVGGIGVVPGGVTVGGAVGGTPVAVRVGVPVGGAGVAVFVGATGVMVPVGVRVAVGGTGVADRVEVRVAVAVGVRVDVGATGVLVRVAVGGTGVAVRVAVGGTAVAVRVDVGVGVRVAVGGTGVEVRVAVRVAVGPVIVTLLLAPAPGIAAGPTAGGPGWKALDRLVGVVASEALPGAIAVKDSTATLTRPVGALAEVCDAMTVTVPLALAVTGVVKVGIPVKPADVPPAAESNRSRVLSNETAT